MRRAFLPLLLLLAALTVAHGQSFDASQWTQGTTEVSALWRFHTGDDAAWASPSFDDSSWPLLKTTSTWSTQGVEGYSGYAWYRLRIKLPATTEQLGIDIGHINSAAEVYTDGQLIGANGIMRPKPDWSLQVPANAFPLPVRLNGRSVEIAVRVWKSPVASSYSGGGFHRHPIIGSLTLLESAKSIAIEKEMAPYTFDYILDVLRFCLGFGTFGLFLLERRNREYAWFALWVITNGLFDVWQSSMLLHQGSATLAQGYGELFLQPVYLCFLLFFWGFLNARRGRLFWTAVTLHLVGAISNILGFENVIALPTAQAILTACWAVVFVSVIARVALSLKRGSPDARLLIVPVCLFAASNTIDATRLILFFAGVIHSQQPLTIWSGQFFSIYLTSVFQLLTLAAISFAILLRFTRAAQEEKRLATELADAHEIQSNFVPDQLPDLGNLRLAAAYLPATEVGGDFYQVFPQRDGSILLAVGDVSGKGLKAAMLGTLIVGAIRTLEQEDLSPAQILVRLNRQLVASASDGFVTCLVLRVSSSGGAVLANAGHLAPYLNGRELPLENGLPLGLSAEAAYAESTFALPAGSQLTLLSDGVVEARNGKGELFGFERTAEISHLPADEIAQKAQAFGQEDDITVLTLTRPAGSGESPSGAIPAAIAPA